MFAISSNVNLIAASEVSNSIAASGISNLLAVAEKAGTNPVNLLLLALAIVSLGLLMRKTGRRVASTRGQPRTSVRKQFADLEQRQQQQGTRRDVEAVMLELDQLARQIHGRLDTKLAQLETVIRDADERIDRLSRLSNTTQDGQGIDITLDPEEPREPGREHSEVRGKPFEQEPTHERAREAAEPGPRDENTPSIKENRHAAVYRLADKGFEPVDIAQETGKTAGEVELILALRNAKNRSPRPHANRSDTAPSAMDR